MGDAVSSFLLPVDEYQQHIDPIKDWIDQSALYVSKMKGMPYEVARGKILEKLKSGQIKPNNPKIVCFERGENQDREKTVVPLSKYLKDVKEHGNILAPTFTTYHHPSVMPSEIVGFLDFRVAGRNRFKKEAARQKALGNMIAYVYNHNQQDSAKRTNNATSGSFVAEGSVINNPSAHSTLTSVTRSIGSLSNASNERLISGNRHYYTPQIALNNLISISSGMEAVHIQAAMDKYNLHWPTADETMECVKRSLSLYSYEIEGLKDIRAFIDKMTPIERAAFVYNGDFYHLRVYNPEMIRAFIDELSYIDDTATFEDPIAILKAADGLTINYAHQVSMSTVKGIGTDYSKIDYKAQCRMAFIAQNIDKTVIKYKDFLRAFFLTKNLPCTIATIPKMMRRSVVLSDTDSTMFSVDEWVLWYFGKLDFSDRGFAVAGSVMYIATQSIAHILAQFSANMNVERKRLFTLSMKPEYCFPVFVQTPVSKHYYTAKLVQEGNVYSDIEMEIKGVHLKDSSVPKQIILDAAICMEKIIRTVMSGKKVSLMEYLTRTADIERMILSSLEAGEVTYLKRNKVKEAKSYKKEPIKSPYQFFMLWEHCFSAKYVSAVKPPYNAVRVPVTLTSRRKIKEWLDAMEDRVIAAKIEEWYTRTGQTKVTQLLLPIDICLSYGIPAEIKSIVDRQKIVLSLTKAHRNVLESLGFCSKPNMLISQQGY